MQSRLKHIPTSLVLSGGKGWRVGSVRQVLLAAMAELPRCSSCQRAGLRGPLVRLACAKHVCEGLRSQQILDGRDRQLSKSEAGAHAVAKLLGCSCHQSGGTGTSLFQPAYRRLMWGVCRLKVLKKPCRVSASHRKGSMGVRGAREGECVWGLWWKTILYARAGTCKFCALPVCLPSCCMHYALCCKSLGDQLGFQTSAKWRNNNASSCNEIDTSSLLTLRNPTLAQPPDVLQCLLLQRNHMVQHLLPAGGGGGWGGGEVYGQIHVRTQQGVLCYERQRVQLHLNKSGSLACQ